MALAWCEAHFYILCLRELVCNTILRFFAESPGMLVSAMCHAAGEHARVPVHRGR